MSQEYKTHILFMCVANSARSQMAEGLARSMAPKGVKISSAGSNPTSVRPEAKEVMQELGIDISSQYSKSIDEIDLIAVDTVVTLCADEVCPAYLGNAKKLHWGLPDPAAVKEKDPRLRLFREVRDELAKRIRTLF